MGENSVLLLHFISQGLTWISNTSEVYFSFFWNIVWPPGYMLAAQTCLQRLKRLWVVCRTHSNIKWTELFITFANFHLKLLRIKRILWVLTVFKFLWVILNILIQIIHLFNVIPRTIDFLLKTGPFQDFWLSLYC